MCIEFVCSAGTAVLKVGSVWLTGVEVEVGVVEAGVPPRGDHLKVGEAPGMVLVVHRLQCPKPCRCRATRRVVHVEGRLHCLEASLGSSQQEAEQQPDPFCDSNVPSICIFERLSLGIV